ncbi:AP-4 complex subunit mu-like [Senna tora]|uniref:AP-4 complex subunit mu-like n=1 Tax=Senna tora TaxID=362788 RepID=A0A834U004_9FABA|nr:AP-4 complex subunit mu-like [Senna tora]
MIQNDEISPSEGIVEGEVNYKAKARRKGELKKVGIEVEVGSVCKEERCIARIPSLQRKTFIMISHFFVLSQGADNVVFRDYRGEVQKASAETFSPKVKFWKEDGEEDAPPNIDGVNYFHVKVAGLFFVATTRVNVSPSLALELLQRIAQFIKDYRDVLNEDSLRKNFVLVNELLLEVIAHWQTVLKPACPRTWVMCEQHQLRKGPKKMPATAITKSVVANEPGGRIRDEIFVDIRLALNEDLRIGRTDYRSSGVVILDDCNFHESVHLDSFDVDRMLTGVPPDGEFPVMNYRMTQPFKPPFRINALIEETGSLTVI